MVIDGNLRYHLLLGDNNKIECYALIQQQNSYFAHVDPSNYPKQYWFIVESLPENKSPCEIDKYYIMSMLMIWKDSEETG